MQLGSLATPETRGAAAGAWPLDLALLGGVLALVLAVHAPALGSAFAGDEQILLYDAANMPLLEYLLHMHGGHLMPVHKLVILAMHRVFGYQAAPFFALAVATHLLNAALLYAGLRQVVAPTLAAFGAAFWGAALVHQSSLSWFSVYGQILVVTCVLLVWLSWLRREDRPRRPSAATLLRWNLLLLVAGTTFGVGIALAVAAPWLAWAFVEPLAARRRAFLGLMPAAFLVPALYLLAFSTLDPESSPLAGSTDPWRAARLFFALPAGGLASLSAGAAATQQTGLILWGPWSGWSIDRAFPLLRLAAAALALALLAAFWLAAPPLRRRALGAALWCAAVYGIIAVGRAQFVSIMSVARVATEPRYQYAALVGVAMLVTFSLASVWALVRRSRPGERRAAPVLGASLLACWLALLAAGARPVAREIQAKSFAPAGVMLKNDLAALEAVIASAPPGSDVYIVNRDYDGTRWLFDAVNRPDRFPGMAALFVATHEEDEVDGRRVRFVEARKDVLERIRARPERRVARLLVSRQEAKALGVRFYHVALRRAEPPKPPVYRRRRAE